MDIDASLLSKIMKAEESLSAMEKKNDELADLPNGHPAKVALLQAREKYEQQQSQEKQKEQVLKKAKKAKKAKRAKRRNVEEDGKRQEEINEITSAVKGFNQRLDDISSDIEQFATRDIREFEETLGELPRARASLDRIKRMFFAFGRGVMDSKIRANNIILDWENNNG